MLFYIVGLGGGVDMSIKGEGNSVDPTANQTEGDVDESRRAAMLRFAKYTAPAMLALLLTADMASAATSGGGGGLL
jgi:hypothetical protein